LTTRVHRTLKVITFNANGIEREHQELSRQLQKHYINMALLSETHLKPHKRFFIPNFHIYQTNCFPSLREELLLQSKKCIPHNHVDLPPLVLAEATGVWRSTGSSKILLTAIYKFLGYAWSDTDITALLNLRRKSLVAGDLNAKNTV
jgi:hypothetical protein